MPVLFRGECRGCGHQTSLMQDQFVAVLVDHPVEGAQQVAAGAVIHTPGDMTMETFEDRRLFVLPHPIESSALSRAGFTWSEAYAQGRLVHLSNVVCRRCGTVFRHRRLATPPASGCWVQACVLVCVGGAVYWWGRSIPLAVIVAAFSLVPLLSVWERLATRRYLRRFADRAMEIEGNRACPTCGIDDAAPLGNEMTVSCPACKQPTMKFNYAGIN